MPDIKITLAEDGSGNATVLVDGEAVELCANLSEACGVASKLRHSPEGASEATQETINEAPEVEPEPAPEPELPLDEPEEEDNGSET